MSGNEPRSVSASAKGVRNVSAARWVPEAITDAEERELLREVASLLRETPVSDTAAPLAVIPGHLSFDSLAQTATALSYRPIEGQVLPLPPIKQRRRPGFRETRVRKARIPDVRLVESKDERETGDTAAEIDALLALQRPGEGGRQSPLRAYTVSTATAQLYEKFGEPVISRHGDALMQIFIAYEDGDGIIGARLSTRDVQNGETAMGQVHPALAGADKQGLRPRLIVVTTENSGGLAYDERCDFDLIEREIFAGRCRWVWFRDVKRLIRNVSPFYRFRDTLLETETDLWLTEYAGRGVPADWDTDDIQLGIEAILAERDRKGIYQQTHAPLMTNWLGEGRGWPGALRFGFRRNPLTKFLEVDPAQWPFVRMAYETYVACEDGEGGGIRGVSEALRTAGCPLSDSSIKRLLGDPIYVNGEHSVERAGVRYVSRPIELSDPIPADLFARVQELRKLRRGTEKRHVAGTYALNGLVEHACGNRLRAKPNPKRPTVPYVHYFPKGGAVPEECRGWSIDARELERAVIREVRRLASCRKLQKQWTDLAKPTFAKSGALLDEQTRHALQVEIDRLKKMRAQLEADFVRKIGTGEEAGDILASFHKLTAGLDGQIKTLNERLTRFQVLDNLRRSTRPADDDPLVKVLLDVLTEETPDDPHLIRRRASLLQTVLSKVVVYDLPDGSVEIELHGPLVPDDLPPLRPLAPVVSARDQLIDTVTGKSAEGPVRATDRRIRAAKAAVTESEGLDEDRDADWGQPGHKAYLADQLSPLSPPKLPKLGKPGRRRRSQTTAQSTGAGPSLVPAWISPRLRVITSNRP